MTMFDPEFGQPPRPPAIYRDVVMCLECGEHLEDGDTCVRDHDGNWYHIDCWKDGGCKPPGLDRHSFDAKDHA